MRNFFIKNILFILVAALAFSKVSAQTEGFISIYELRGIEEVKQAEQQVQSVVEGWKRELKSMHQQIDKLRLEINNNKLVWSQEKTAREEEQLNKLIREREIFTKQKFEPGGEYDAVVKQIMKLVEEKIYNKIYLHFFENNKDR